MGVSGFILNTTASVTMEMKAVRKHQDDRSILITSLPVRIQLLFIRLIKTLIENINYNLIQTTDLKLKNEVAEIVSTQRQGGKRSF